MNDNPSAILFLGENRHTLALRGDGTVDAVVCDPPYGLGKEPDMVEVLRHWLAGDDYEATGGGFMGKTWDSFVPGPATWREVFRVLKPGGHLLAFAGSRTFDMMGLAIRLAGFEIRDTVSWLYGSGFPKSLDVSKAIDKIDAAAEREPDEYTGANYKNDVYGRGMGGGVTLRKGAATTHAAQTWQGWGTALKPAWEPVIVARRPLAGTVAANVLAWGTGAINVDACRIGTGGGTKGCTAGPSNGILGDGLNGAFGTPIEGLGRWPANVALDEAAAALLDEQSGTLKSGANPERRGSDKFRTAYGDFEGQADCVAHRGADAGGASRFYYVAKPSKAERNAGTDNSHPTVKPVALMRWLVRLVTPPGGIVLDPFLGSGTTGIAALAEGFDFVGCELGPDYMAIAEARIRHHHPDSAVTTLDLTPAAVA